MQIASNAWQASGQSRSGLDVLIVEDEDDAAESLMMLLRTQKHNVRWARNGTAALNLVEGNPPDLILLDVGLPDISGHEVAQRIKERQLLKAPLVVVITGHDQPEDTEQLREMGIDLYLTKPVNPESLLALIDRFRRILA
jgi:DNA-binding response OmpR family regulator